MNPHNYAHLIFDKLSKMCSREKTASSINVAGESVYLPAEN
jgi:hypothetical protein